MPNCPFQLERADSDDRDELIRKSEELRKKRDDLLKLVEQYKDSDPDVIKQEKLDTEVVRITCIMSTEGEKYFNVFRQTFHFDEK